MKFKSLDEMREHYGVSTKKPQKEWADTQKKKILTCPKCKNVLTWIEGTNVIVCRNEIGEGKTCNFKKTVSEKTANFLRYLNS